MSRLRTLATHLPLWGTEQRRTAGADEDALTLAVAAGRAALDAADDPGAVAAVTFITREVPVLEGGSEAVLLAALGLASTTRVSIVLGRAASPT